MAPRRRPRASTPREASNMADPTTTPYNSMKAPTQKAWSTNTNHNLKEK
jgi:hypothetical protein